MNLAELAFGCYVYASMTDYDTSYLDFRAAINDNLDLSNAVHRQALITWLNQWGCRQFSKECHQLASDEIYQWHSECKDLLPAKDADLHLLSAHEIELASKAYGKLASKIACRKMRGTTPISVTVGPTGAAKILFALRPKSLVPWDEPIRAELNLDTSRQSYFRYHTEIKASLLQLEPQCNAQGFSLDDLPKNLSRPGSTTPKLIDEYYWVTITKQCTFPGNATLAKWMAWDKAFFCR